MIFPAKAGGQSDSWFDLIREVGGGQEVVEHHGYRVFLHLSVAVKKYKYK